MAKVGTPPGALTHMRTQFWWPRLVACAPTLAYDAEILAFASTGGAVPDDLANLVQVPTLVLNGTGNGPGMVAAGQALAPAIDAYLRA